MVKNYNDLFTIVSFHISRRVMKSILPSAKTLSFALAFAIKQLSFLFIILFCFCGHLFAAVKPVYKHKDKSVKKIDYPARGHYGKKTNISQTQSGVTPPMVSYGGSRTFVEGVAITDITPAASGVAAQAYNNTPVSLGSGFARPHGIALDHAGNIYVADVNNSAVKKIPIGGGATVTFATGFSSPARVAVDTAGSLFVTDQTNTLYKVPANGGAGSPFGSGWSFPTTVGVDAKENIFVASGGFVQELYGGTGSPHYLGSASILNPIDLALDSAGNVFVADYGGGGVIREILGSNHSVVNLKSGFQNLN